jgi:hypothetical protein
MLAYKFLLPGGVGPFSGFAWPEGRWVAASEAPAPCRTGVHGCRLGDLPWWLQDELWVAEFADPVTTAGRKLVSTRARLLERVDAWNAETSRTFAEACARRARDRAADALERTGAVDAGRALRACDTPERLRDVAGELDVPEAARISVLMASDGARRAISGPTATAAYIAAHAAREVGGPDAMDAERRWQSDWLARRLGLAVAEGN